MINKSDFNLIYQIFKMYIQLRKIDKENLESLPKIQSY
jgi:hypothetical protein